MNRTLLPDRADSRRHLGRLHDFVAKELPNEIAHAFDPRIESDTLGALGLILFVRQRWGRISPDDQARMRNWLSRSAAHCVRGILDWAMAIVVSPGAESIISPLRRWTEASPHDVFERVFAALDPRNRRRHGFYCTPSPLAEFVVARANRTLIDQFGCRDGILATEIPDSNAGTRLVRVASQRRLNLLDPAVGSGAFLSAVIKIAWQQFKHRQIETVSGGDWSAMVTENLLPRIHACDIQLAPLAGAHIRLATSLLRSGFDFTTPVDLTLWQINPLATLDESNDSAKNPENPNLSKALDRFQNTPFSLIIGNPPYGAHQASASSGMRKLMHGRCGGAGGDVDYFQSQNGPIAERKTWLYDHYIQFLRFAHWRIERAGGGVIAFLTNRGFLEHVTMRGLRHQWLKSFDRIEIHDFQGGDDRSNRDHLSVRENVFGVRSGIALSVLAKLPDSSEGTRQIDMQVHRGTAIAKLRSLCDQTLINRNVQRLTPKEPLFSFQVEPNRPKTLRAEFIPLDECFPVKSSAVVTARDALVIGFERSELLTKIDLLRDNGMDDIELREMFFQKSRSPRYPRGDTRGWKLAEARALVLADPSWQDHVQRCSYRPLDDRYIYWHSRMIDWRRMAVSKLMVAGDNPALIARRQTPDDESANFFWITRWPSIDGILRSDNRGNEYVFPLRSLDPDAPYNLSEPLIELASRKLGREFDLASRTPLEMMSRDLADDGPLTGCDLFAYLVGQVFSRSYRAMQHAAMRHDFIPIAVTEDEKFFRRLAQSGRSLVRTITEQGSATTDETTAICRSDWVARPESSKGVIIEITKPKYDQGQIRIGAHLVADGVDDETWGFRAGSHQVCRKWLGDRAGREFTCETRRQFADVRQTIQRLQAICRSIEAYVDEYGGWDRILG